MNQIFCIVIALKNPISNTVILKEVFVKMQLKISSVTDNGNKERFVMFINAKLYETIKSNIWKKFPTIIQEQF